MAGALAASFLDDFDEEGEAEEQRDAPASARLAAKKGAEEEEQDDEELQNEGLVPKGGSTRELTSARRLLDSAAFAEHLETLRAFAAAQSTGAGAPSASGAPPAPGGARSDSEALSRAYALVLRANAQCKAVDEEVSRLHAGVAEAYGSRFPELEQLVPDPVQFLRTVALLGNARDVAAIDLGAALTPAQAMVVSMSGSRLKSEPPLAEELLALVLGACRASDELVAAKEQRLLPFVAGQMALIAPNVTALLGSEVTAQVLAATGGLAGLAKVPSCNVQVVGKGSKELHGFARVAAMRHFGVIHGCPLVQECLPEHRVKAMRTVAGRVALASRVDLTRSDAAGNQGRAWAEEIRGKLEQWHAPPPGKTVKPLPLPVTDAKKKRGGKNARRLKALYGETEVSKQANRMAFGVGDDEYGDAAMGRTLGMVGKDGSGHMRVTVADKKTWNVQQKVKGRAKGAEAGPSAEQAARRDVLNKLAGGDPLAAMRATDAADASHPNSARPANAPPTSSIAFSSDAGITLHNAAAAHKRPADSADSNKYFGALSFKKQHTAGP